MASAMAGLIAQPSLQSNVQASLPSLSSSKIPRQRVSCSLRLTSTSGFGKDLITSGISAFKVNPHGLCSRLDILVAGLVLLVTFNHLFLNCRIALEVS